jgi:S-adenosylmethionine:tRNA ribosyltransferase-isomerase
VRVSELAFDRPEGLSAREPPEARGVPRDGVRLLVSASAGPSEQLFSDLPRWLSSGDLLVVNRSQVEAASLPAVGAAGEFRLNVSSAFGRRVYLVEPRRSFREPGPLPLYPQDEVRVGSARVRFIAPFPGLPRLWFVVATRPLESLMDSLGSPIRYGYLEREWALPFYETIFGRVRGSSETPSAGRPFTPRLLRALRERGVRFASVLLHASVSSLEVEGSQVEQFPSVPEPYAVPESTVKAVEATRRKGRRVVAVGTTVVRALESAFREGRLVASSGFTRRWVTPKWGVHTVDGLITGFHDPRTTHLAMLFALAGSERIRADYRTAVAQGFRWHEFGDSHLILND